MRRMSPFFNLSGVKFVKTALLLTLRYVHLCCWFVSEELLFYTISKCGMSLVVSHSHKCELSNKVLTYIFKKHFIICLKAGHKARWIAQTDAPIWPRWFLIFRLRKSERNWDTNWMIFRRMASTSTLWRYSNETNNQHISWITLIRHSHMANVGRFRVKDPPQS